jgi:beta-glucanase (GH16 family)
MDNKEILPEQSRQWECIGVKARNTVLLSVCLLLATFSLVATPASASASMGPRAILLVNDQFSGHTLNSKLWNIKTLPADYRNGELQTYSPSGVAVKDGALQIVSQRQSDDAWTSGEVTSKFAYTYGTFSMRIKVSGLGRGVWPAAWMQGTPGVWPDNGEIDIMENIDGAGIDYATVHGGGSYGHWQISRYVPVNVAQWHTYRMVKTPDSITWFIDNRKVGEVFKSQTPAGGVWPFSAHRYYSIFDIAMGGIWDGAPNATTPGRVVMSVDWYQVWTLPTKIGL